MTSRYILKLISLAILIRPSRANAFAEKKYESDYVTLQINAVIDMMKSCFPWDENIVSLVGTESIELLSAGRSLWESTPLTLIGNSTSSAIEAYRIGRQHKPLYENLQLFELERKLRIAIVAASSNEILGEMLKKLKNSMWWNSQGFFVILDLEDNCRSAHTFLLTTWEMNILSSVLICHAPQEGLFMYAYNPYTSSAPPSWENAGIYQSPVGHPWSIFKQKYIEARSHCNDLDFDKTRTLDGYPIRMNAVVRYPLLFFNPLKSGWKKFSGEDGIISGTLWTKLNATRRLKMYPRGMNMFEYSDADKTSIILMDEVINGSLDYNMNALFNNAEFKWKVTYPHASSGLCIITMHTGHMAQILKIMSTLSLQEWMAVLFISMSSFIVLKFLVGRRFFDALFDVIKLVLLSSIFRLPRSNSAMIFFGPVFVLMMIIHALFDSRLTSLLVRPILNPNINTLKDLNNSGFSVNVPVFYENILSEVRGVHMFREGENRTCIDALRKEANVACIGDCMRFLIWKKEKDFHLSKEKISSLQYVFITRQDWPLFTRFNELVQRMVDAGLIEVWRKHSLDLYNSRYSDRKRRTIPDARRTLHLGDLTFSFQILRTGLACAVVVFMAELMFMRCAKIKERTM